MQINREQLAWAAGLFDGEGCTSVRAKYGAPGRNTDSPKTGIVVQVAQCGDPEVLLRFQRAVGGVGTIQGPYPRGEKKPSYFFAASSFEHAQFCLSAMWPWLSNVKRKQAIAAFQKWHAQPRHWHKARKGERGILCHRGHRVEGDNAYKRPDGHVDCRTCKKAAAARFWAKNGHKYQKPN